METLFPWDMALLLGYAYYPARPGRLNNIRPAKENLGAAWLLCKKIQPWFWVVTVCLFMLNKNISMYLRRNRRIKMAVLQYIVAVLFSVTKKLTCQNTIANYIK